MGELSFFYVREGMEIFCCGLTRCPRNHKFESLAFCLLDYKMKCTFKRNLKMRDARAARLFVLI